MSSSNFLTHPRITPDAWRIWPVQKFFRRPDGGRPSPSGTYKQDALYRF